MAAKNRNNSGNSKGNTTTRQRSNSSSRGGSPSKGGTRRNHSSSSGSSHSKVGHSNDNYNNDQYNSTDNYSSNENPTGKEGRTLSNSGSSIKPARSGNHQNRNNNYSNNTDENYGSNNGYSSKDRSNNRSGNNNNYNSRPPKDSSRYNDEPINDPPYDNYDSDNYSDEDNYNDSGTYSKEGNNNEDADMTFTEEEVYGDSNNDNGDADMVFTEEEVYGDSDRNSDSNNVRSENTRARGSINRVWVWAGGAVPRQAINNPRSNWWQNRASLGMTDYVIALNDHDFSRGLGIKPNYIDNRNRSNRWNPICDVLRTINSFNISPHLMVFLPPNPAMIREAAQVLTEIINRCEVTPRSIQLDLEGWWTRRSQADRQRGEQAIQQYFKDEWRGGNLELGIGVTCIGSTPGAVHGAVEKLDFVIPQIYASPRNYGRPIRENSVRRHFDRAANALNRGGKVIVGQTAYSRYVNPEVMKEMLTILLRINHANVGGVSEIAYWSDIHLLNSRNNRDFFKRMTDLVKGNGLNLNNINRL